MKKLKVSSTLETTITEQSIKYLTAKHREIGHGMDWKIK